MTEAGAQPRRGFPVGLTLAVAVAFALLVALGVWQLQRLKWKEGLLAHIAALQSAPAAELGPVLDRLAHGANADFTRVRAICPGLATAPYLEMYSIRDAQAGVRLISACQVDSASYRTVLVDRGFVADTVSARPKVDPAERAPTTVVGILRTPERANAFMPKNRPGRWFSRDIPAMARGLDAAAPAPIFLFAETSTNPEWGALTPAPLPSEIPNRHLEYALTWFGLAAALLGVYAAVLFRKGPA